MQNAVTTTTPIKSITYEVHTHWLSMPAPMIHIPRPNVLLKHQEENLLKIITFLQIKIKLLLKKSRGNSHQHRQLLPIPRWASFG